MKKIFPLLLIILSAFISHAQPSAYKSVDAAVEKLGSLSAFNVATIADTITAYFPGSEQKARAIFYWIANNISIDPKATKQNDKKNTVPEKVIELRKTTPLGFSLLLQEMCSDVNIRCISVDGYMKYSAEDINQPADEVNHSWNVVQLGQSPDTWFFVDACRASGYLDLKMTTFTKEFTPGFFFTEKKLFNLANYPDNAAWQLGGGPKALKEFYSFPVVSNYAMETGVGKPDPLIGYVKANLKTPVTFKFTPTAPIKIITVIFGDLKKQPKPEEMKFNDNGGVISFDYKFKKEETYPFRILADGKEILEYMVEVNE